MNHSARILLSCLLFPAVCLVSGSGLCHAGAGEPAYRTIDEAIAKGDAADVKLHLAANPQSANRGGRDTSRPPLEQAVQRNQPEIAGILLAAGADPNSASATGRTPLHLAVERKSPAMAAALLKAGAKPDAADKDGWTPLHHAAAKDQVETAKALLAGGASPLALSKLGGTPLHEAAASGGAEMIRLLLDHKADPAIKSKQDVTALDIAREYKNQPAIDALAGK
jgi:ankyrin repeat protein